MEDVRFDICEEQNAMIGVLLVNTGTPDAPEEAAIGAYLSEFLSDPAIVTAPGFVRRLAAWCARTTRPAKTVHKYREFWTENGSPFMLTSKAQANLLEQKLQRMLANGANEQQVHVALAMRYGNPSIQAGLQQLKDAGCTKLVALPAYPQQVRVCAGTCLQAVRDNLDCMDWSPELVEIPHFYQQPAYRQALAEAVRAAWAPGPQSVLIVSLHSTLMKDIQAGDPYRDQTEETAANLMSDLGLSPEQVRVSFQSKFDSRQWLQPSTESLVKELAQQGVTDLAVVCPGFVADNLETFFDVDRGLRKMFLDVAAEGSSFTYVPCLNEHPLLIQAMADAVMQAAGL